MKLKFFGVFLIYFFGCFFASVLGDYISLFFGETFEFCFESELGRFLGCLISAIILTVFDSIGKAK